MDTYLDMYHSQNVFYLALKVLVDIFLLKTEICCTLQVIRALITSYLLLYTKSKETEIILRSVWEPVQFRMSTTSIQDAQICILFQ